MKVKNVLLLFPIFFMVIGCGNTPTPSSGDPGEVIPPDTPPGPVDPPGPSDPVKVTVAKHTIKDNNPPIDIDAVGDRVDEATWNSFKNGAQSKFNNHYNYTYRAYTGTETYEAFTKNGYYMRSSAGEQYYERKSGNTFYQYISKSDGYLRQETTFDIVEKYTYRIHHEIYVHMFDFDDYEYDTDFGYYTYWGGTFSSQIQFIDGYLVYLNYSLSGGFSFVINMAFQTEIEIPKSYYYE